MKLVREEAEKKPSDREEYCGSEIKAESLTV